MLRGNGAQGTPSGSPDGGHNNHRWNLFSRDLTEDNPDRGGRATGAALVLCGERSERTHMSNWLTGVICTSTFCASLALQTALSQDLGDFEEEDFQQFFGLIEDGKITKEKLEARCATKEAGFTFAAKNLTHEGALERVDYNETKLDSSVDGRPLRSKFHNAAFGEWTGSTFKPICAGLYLISLNVTMAPSEAPRAGEVSVDIFLRRAGETRPGSRMATAYMAGDSIKIGHATLVLALRTGDEVSTYSQSNEADQKRVLKNASFSATKIAHIDDLIEEFDSDAWDADLAALESTASVEATLK